MKLYHGTNAEIPQINLNESRVGKDFGLGFYLTPDRQVAQRQAERKFAQYGFGKVQVYEYDIEEETMQPLHVLNFETLTREMIARLMEERSLSMRDAMDIVYKSKTFSALNNTKSGLYFQSPAYLYDTLLQELNYSPHFCGE